VEKLAKLLERGDTIVDGGNSRWTDDKRRAKTLRRKASTMSTSACREACGARGGLLHDGRRPAESGQAARADP